MEILLLVCAVLLVMIWSRVGRAYRAANVAANLVGTANESTEPRQTTRRHPTKNEGQQHQDGARTRPRKRVLELHVAQC